MEITPLLMVISMKTVSLTNPMTMAVLILIMSIMATMTLFLTTVTSWLSFVVILTFSSGMMTLFIYTSSLSANEKTKENKMIFPLTIIILTSSCNKTIITQKETMKLFSNNNFMMVMATILIMTMLSISSHGHHPNQTTSSSF